MLGRLDDVVVSGGVNVPLPAVSRRLAAHPGVDQVEVVGVPDAEWGQRVTAFVVPTATGDREPPSREELQGLGAETLYEPRLWPEYHPGYYAVFVRDPDGNNVEAVFHGAAPTAD